MNSHSTADFFKIILVERNTYYHIFRWSYYASTFTTSFVQYSVHAFAYFSIVIFEAIIRGEIRWAKYVTPAVGCRIGFYIAHQSNFCLKF